MYILSLFNIIIYVHCLVLLVLLRGISTARLNQHSLYSHKIDSTHDSRGKKYNDCENACLTFLKEPCLCYLKARVDLDVLYHRENSTLTDTITHAARYIYALPVVLLVNAVLIPQ